MQGENKGKTVSVLLKCKPIGLNKGIPKEKYMGYTVKIR